MVYDFVEVTKASKRMCDSNNCSNCPASSDNNGADVSCSNFRFDMPEKYAELVLKWAKENPEKVYPTWAEYLVLIGVYPPDTTIFQTPLKAPIPAGIAEKLGLKPNEV